MDRNRACCLDQRGFTLVELQIAAVLTMIALFVTLALMDFAVRSEPEIADRNAKIQGAEVALERMVRELRQGFEVVSASPSDISFLTYSNRITCGGSQLGTARACRVTYSCAGGDCTRTASEEDGTASGPVELIVSGLQSDAVFSYDPNAAGARAVAATMSFPADDSTGGDAITVTDGAAMRNLPEVLGN